MGVPPSDQPAGPLGRDVPRPSSGRPATSPTPGPGHRADGPRTPCGWGPPAAARVVADAERLAGARLAGRGSRAEGHDGRSRAYTHSAGTGQAGWLGLVELHFVNLMGDAALTVSLADTVFAIPTDEARGQVAQFLALTMAPFALLAPFVGPLLDRFRHGRRWAIGTTLALHGPSCAGCWPGRSPTTHPWLFPAALGCLVASKAYGVTRATGRPQLLCHPA